MLWLQQQLPLRTIYSLMPYFASVHYPSCQAMNAQLINVSELMPKALVDAAAADSALPAPEWELDTFAQQICQELQVQLHLKRGETVHAPSLQAVATRIAAEVERICYKSDRIQQSGCVRSWHFTLARHRLQKCLDYYHLGAKQGRIELHSTLGAIVYRYIAPMRSPLTFQARYHLIEDFLQGFSMESLKAFRRENQLPEDYRPRTQLEVAEYLAFTEQYARRRIALASGGTQQLIVLRAQGFARRQPAETALDMEMAAESPKTEESEQGRSPAVQQVRASMVSESTDPTEAILRDRVVEELVQYLESIGQSDCVDYLCLKLQDLSAPEIDAILSLEPRQRDYLQQRFKYHVEKFSRHHQWQLVHQWLGADLDQNLGMSSQQWDKFWQQLSPQEQHLLELKRAQISEPAIAVTLKWTPKQVQKRWFELLALAWQVRNGSTKTRIAS